MADRDVVYGLLGPLTAVRAGEPVAIGGPKERAVLAQLLARANTVVTADALIEGVWADAAPRSAQRTLQAYVARLRRALQPAGGPDAILVTAGSGYRLHVTADECDALRFEQLARQGAGQLRRSDDGAARSLRQALDLWRGEAFAEFDAVECCRAEGRRLGELRLVALEARLDADLDAGQAAELVAELELLVAEHPFRERFWSQLMLELARNRVTRELTAEECTRYLGADRCPSG